MCGILGAIDLQGRRLFDRARLQRMATALAHRGPDGEGVHIEPGLAMAARRLALVDVERGDQPVSDEHGQRWAVQNGELYDDAGLRRDLVARGHQLRTRCDTELWPHLYEEHGEAVFERAAGQFAVAIWDRPARTLLLARDRLGVRPLFLAEAAGWLLFASEIKALLASGMIPARLDRRGLDHAFVFYAPGPVRTMFEGVRSVAPGTYVRVRQGEISHHRYWEMAFPRRGEERRAAAPEVLVDELEDHLTRAVERRLRGDVPVVSYVSGGLDSSLVLALASRLQGTPMQGFAIALEGAGPDERHKAKSTADYLGAPLDTIVLDRAAIAAAYPELVLATEEPTMDTSAACLLALAARVRRRGYEVALSGEGADEAFGGYVWYKLDKALRAAARPGMEWIASTLRGLAASLVGGRRRLPQDLLGGARPPQLDTHDALARARDFFYTDALWQQLEGSRLLDDIHLSPEMRHWHPLHQAQYVDYKLMLPAHLLAGKGDRVAMAHAVETRHPFLDAEVVAFAASLAPEYKLRGLTGKWLLRELGRRHLPRAIAARPKTMLRADRARSLLGAHRPPWVDELLSPESLAATGLFRPEAVARERARQMAFPALTPRRWVFDATLTTIVGTQLLHHLFLGGGLCRLAAWSAPGGGDERWAEAS